MIIFSKTGVAVLTALAGLAAVTAWAGGSDEELFFADIPAVSLVSRREESVMQTPAAVTVLTQEDIRRSGATSLPELLRQVPGLNVAHVDAHTWAVSVRGFNDMFANKLLVLIDGRSVYSPLFSGTLWDMQNVMVEDIERIEVVRGPGGTLWGANAVNGVINIVTKSAQETQGGLISAGGGTQEQGFGAARYGGAVGSNLFYRVYGQGFNRDDYPTANGGDGHDAWYAGQGGFRLDWRPETDNRLTFQGDLYQGRDQQRTTVPLLVPPYSTVLKDSIEVSGGNLLGRWTHTLAEQSAVKIQTYYDHTDRDTAVGRDWRDTFDLDMQHNFNWLERQEIVWGLGYRLTADRFNNTPTVQLSPDERTTHLFSAFVQNEITLVPDRLRLILGSKIEHNDYTGIEVQPSARLLWTPNRRNTVWFSMARAVRTPSRSEEDVRFNQQTIPPNGLYPGSPVALAGVVGRRAYLSEELVAYEIGYRVRPHDRLWVEVAAFYNVYQRLHTVEAGAPEPVATPAPPHLFIPATLYNHMVGETYGCEGSVNWQALDWWRLQAVYSFLAIQLHPTRAGLDSSLELNYEGSSPRQQFALTSLLNLPGHMELDGTLRYVDSLPSQNVPGYLTLDVRLGWKPNPHWEFAIVGQNLLDNQHPEFGLSSLSTQLTEVPRSVYGKVTWRF